MPRTTTVIIGAGQAGLAMSRCLSELGIEHVVLERGKLAQRWRSQSWDSLRLLTPNWMTRLPGFQYDGHDRDGFMSVPELIAFLERYAASSAAPVLTDTTVQSVERSGNGFRVVTNRGVWSASSVVVATGYCDLPAVPAASRGLSPSVRQMVPAGLSASRTIAGRWRPRRRRFVHRRAARRRDSAIRTAGHAGCRSSHAIASTPPRTRHPLVAGSAWRAEPGSRRRSGYRAFAPPAVASAGWQAGSFDPSIWRCCTTEVFGWWAGSATSTAIASALPTISWPRPPPPTSRWPRSSRGSIGSSPRPASLPRRPSRSRPTWPLAADAPDSLDLKDERIDTVIWATGYRRAYPWLRVPVFDARGEIMHNGGITPESRALRARPEFSAPAELQLHRRCR